MNRKLWLYGFLILSATVIAILLYWLVSDKDEGTPEVVLPPAIAENVEGIQSGDDDNEGSRVEVTPETVQAVLATLSRPDSYFRSVTVESFWDDGSSMSVISTWVKGDSIRIAETRDGETINVLILGDSVWKWYGDSSQYYTGEAAEGDADKYQRILTYEAVLELDQSDITDAGYTQYSSESCIFAEYHTGALGYLYRIYVSVDTGLLMGAETYDGKSLVMSMSSEAPELSTPADNVFEQPS